MSIAFWPSSYGQKNVETFQKNKYLNSVLEERKNANGICFVRLDEV